jgi:DNA-binding Lrp family transcriptional regulator
MTNVKLDEKNRKILEQLLKNSRLSYREIARNLKLSPTSVLLRIKDMERKGIIKGYTTILDHEILGYELTAIIEITVSKGKLLQVEKQIAQIPNVLAVYDITGLTDAMVIAKFKSRKELSKFIKELLALPFVERTNTHLVLTTVKEDFRLL